MNFGPLTKKVIGTHVDAPNWTNHSNVYTSYILIIVFPVELGAPGGIKLGSAPYF